MTKEQYIQKILKKIKATKDIRERIGSDLRTEIDTRLEVGATMEEIIKEKGMPDEVAKGFNQTYCDTAMRRAVPNGACVKGWCNYLFCCRSADFSSERNCKIGFLWRRICCVNRRRGRSDGDLCDRRPFSHASRPVHARKHNRRDRFSCKCAVLSCTPSV